MCIKCDIAAWFCLYSHESVQRSPLQLRMRQAPCAATILQRGKRCMWIQMQHATQTWRRTGSNEEQSARLALASLTMSKSLERGVPAAAGHAASSCSSASSSRLPSRVSVMNSLHVVSMPKCCNTDWYLGKH